MMGYMQSDIGVAPLSTSLLGIVASAGTTAVINKCIDANR